MKYWRVYTFLLFVFLSSNKLFSNNDMLQIKLVADSLFNCNKFYDAAIYYQKLDFFSVTEAQKNNAKLLAAKAYMYNKNYSEGLNLLSTINITDAADSLIFNVKYQSALMCYLNNDLPQVESHLQNLKYLIIDTTLILNTYILYTLALNEQYKWDEAKLMLNKYIKNLANDSITKVNQLFVIDSMYQKQLQPKIKSVEKASKMSTFFPGLGQCYAKNYKEGITSFASITAVVGVMAIGVFYQYYFTSLLAGNMLLGKFYLGGIKRAEFLAEKYNYTHAKTYNEFLKTRIQTSIVK